MRDKSQRLARWLAIAGRVGRLAGLLHLDEVAPGVRARAVEVGEAIDLGQPAAGQRLPVPARASGSAASAATARPTKRGVSEITKCGDLASRRASSSSVTLIVLQHHLGAQPAGRDARPRSRRAARGPWRAPRPCGSPRPWRDRRTARAGSGRHCIRRCRPSPRPAARPGRSISSGSAWCAVIRCVSMPSRSMRRPFSRLCSQTGLFHSNSFSPPQMSLTRMSSRPCSARMRSTSARTSSATR